MLEKWEETTVYQETFTLLKFAKMVISIIFMKNIFTNDPHEWHKRCGMATFLQNLILQLSKICENEAMRKFPGIQ